MRIACAAPDATLRFPPDAGSQRARREKPAPLRAKESLRSCRTRRVESCGTANHAVLDA